MEIKELVTKLQSSGDCFFSYARLLENPSFNIERDRQIEILDKLSKECFALRVMLMKGDGKDECASG